MALMDRQDAIDLLDNLIGMVDDNHGSDYDSALRMGIEALKVEEPEYTIEMQEADIDETMKRLRDARVTILPSAEPVRMKGKWMECDHEKWSGETFAYRCSECGGAYHLSIEKVIGIWNFCPNCGADMRGEEDG